MGSGSVTLNGLTDAELIIVLQEKEKANNLFTFNPQAMQPANLGGNPPRSGYNNVTLGWNNPQGIHAVMHILHRLVPDFNHPA